MTLLPERPRSKVVEAARAGGSMSERGGSMDALCDQLAEMSVRDKFAALKAKAKSIAEVRGLKKAVSSKTEQEVAELPLVVATVVAAKERTTELAFEQDDQPGMREMGVGRVLGVLDAVGSQEQALALIDAAESYVILMGFTYDRQDVTDALIRAVRRGLGVRVGLDRRFTLSGKCRDQLQRAKQLYAEGAKVRLLDGGSLSGEYRQVGRAVGGLGIAHAKVLHSDKGTVIGSCNWTTSSRANLETGLWVELDLVEARKLCLVLQGRLDAGVDLRDAEVAREQSRSVSPRSAAGRRARSQSRSALDVEAAPSR